MANQTKPVRMYWRGPGSSDLANNARKFLNYVDSLNPFPNNQMLNEAFKNAMGNRRIVRPDGSIVLLQRGPINSVRVDVPMELARKEKRPPSVAENRFISVDVIGYENLLDGTLLFPISNINAAPIFIPKQFSSYYQRVDGYPGYPTSLAGLKYYPEILEDGPYKVQELIGKLTTASLVARDNSGHTQVVNNYTGADMGLTNSSGAEWIDTWPNVIKNGTTQLHTPKSYTQIRREAYEVNGQYYSDNNKAHCQNFSPPPGSHWLEEYCVNDHGFIVWQKDEGYAGYYKQYFEQCGSGGVSGTWANVTTSYGHVSSAHHAWGYMDVEQAEAYTARFNDWAVEFYTATGTNWHAALLGDNAALAIPMPLGYIYTGTDGNTKLYSMVRETYSKVQTYAMYLRHNGTNILIKSGDAVNEGVPGFGAYNFLFDDDEGYEYYPFVWYCDDKDYNPQTMQLGFLNNGALSFRSIPVRTAHWNGNPVQDYIWYTTNPGTPEEVNYVAYGNLRIVDVVEGIPAPRPVEG